MALDKSIIENARFGGKKDKYDAADVDTFLEKLALQVEVEGERMVMLEKQVKQYKETESSLASALVFAEENSKRIIKEAEERAAAIVRDAEDNADEYEKKLQASFEQQRNKLISEINALRVFYDEYRKAIQKDLESFLQKFETQSAALGVWEDRPESLDEDLANRRPPSIDLNEILSNLPETDSELKEMINGLI